MGAPGKEKPQKLGGKLLEIRKRLGLSQVEMAKALSTKVTQLQGGSISRFETGDREPSFIQLLKYARLAEVNADVLIDDKLNLPKS